MALTELQKKKLIEGINTIKIDTVLKYFQLGDITFDDVPHISDERRRYIQENLNRIPNPAEQAEWAAITELLGSPSTELLNKLSEYISKWQDKLPADNHVEDAKRYRDLVKSQLDEEKRMKEENDWTNIDPFSKPDLMGYLSKYPDTVHKSEIDDSLWNCIDKENVQEIEYYINLFPHGLHADEARDILNAIVEWGSVKMTDDIFCINEYIRNNPDSPFKSQAKIQLLGLKQREINSMRDNPNIYDVNRLMQLINEGIFSDKELISAKVMTPNILKALRSHDITNDLPDIRVAIENSVATCKDGYTDVFFFGIPSTGKTCVLMGLSCSGNLQITFASGGGEYAAALQQYTDVGVTVPSTPGDFVTTLEATINSDTSKGSIVHKLNLVEMSGEEFAFEIANNPDREFSFEQMGTGATQLLQNDNRKVFFLIVDPTANVVRFNREVEIYDGVDDVTGERMTHTELRYCAVNQRTLIQKMVDLFNLPENANIMKKVDSIHIIMTKSDTLGNPVDREDRALQIFNEKYRNHILRPLRNLCEEYNINSNNNFRPKLYTYSLGTFYVGGLYEYDPTDSNSLVDAIKNSTAAVKKQTWWDKLRDIVN